MPLYNLKDEEQPLHVRLFNENGLDPLDNEILSPKSSIKYIQFGVRGINLESLRKDVDYGFSKFGWFGFADTFSSETSRSLSYGGLGLTYNPHYVHKIEPHAQVFGVPRANLPKSFFYTTLGKQINRRLLECSLEKVFFYEELPKGLKSSINWLLDNDIVDLDQAERLKKDVEGHADSELEAGYRNNYQDSYGFNKLTAFAKQGELGRLISTCRATVVRSRVAQIRGLHWSPHDNDLFWHRDSSPFVEMRIIVNLSNPSSNFGIKLDHNCELTFEEGGFYSWDASRPHCPTMREPGDFNRTNIIIGISPWFDFKDNRWVPNQYMAKKHPFDMLLDGDIFEGINCVKIF